MILGPDKLPSALRMFGKTMGEVKKYQDLAKGEISKAMDSAQLNTDPKKDSGSDESNDSVNKKVVDDQEKLATKAKPKKSVEEDEVIAPILDEEG